MKTGDAIATIAQPIARGIDYVLGSNIQGCNGCNRMRENLNAGMSLSDAIYERWFKAKQEGNPMQYQMQVVVSADSIAEAVSKIQGGEILSVQIKPQQPQPRPGISPRPQPTPQ
jgi:hypothetical protein